MFATTLLPLPPPSTSLLPPLSQHHAEPTYHSHAQQQQAHRKRLTRTNNTLTSLTHDERSIATRKLAIAMYGYSWLKPAGCTKTMLGRREEELEREEVERQLREVEIQERMALEQEEQERREELRRQAEEGEVEGVEERDLDEDVPEAAEGSDAEEDEDLDGEEEDEEEEDMEGDLDDDIPDADVEAHESNWVYDTRRESDTESENDDDSLGEHDTRAREQQYRQHIRRRSDQNFAGQDDPAATEAMINAMLDEDELGEYEHQHDLDDDIPDPEMDMDMDMDANLSDEVPDADDDEPGWEHTDSELEESEMDISLLPPHPNSTSRNPGTTHEEMRRVSGNRTLHPMLPPSQSRSQVAQQQQHLQPQTAPRRNLRVMMQQTPGTADDISALISTGATSAVDTTDRASTAAEESAEPRSPNRRSWLNAAGARRNLFGGFRAAPAAANPTDATGQTQAIRRPAQMREMGVTGSSGGLFTPSPRGTPESDGEGDGEAEVPRSRTRSGRLLRGLGVGRRIRRGTDGET